MASRHHVCVIGAGISGLRCAAILLQEGVHVTILEARQRIGGRPHRRHQIVQSDELGWSIDIGANWVHSTIGNPIIRLAAETDTPLHSWVPHTILVDSASNVVEDEVADKILDMVWRILEDAAEYSQRNHSTIGVNESLYDFFEQRCAQELANSSISEYQQELILGLSQMWGAYVGEAVYRQSLKFFFLEDCVDAEDQFIATTYKDIIDRVSEPVLSAAIVQFSKKVVAVQSHQDAVSVVTEDGTEFEFSDVVITCPLGWLQRNISAIRPMTSRLASAINSISYGKLEKIILLFPTPFWDQGREQPVSFFHWNTPSSEIRNSHSKWRIEAVSLAALAPPYNKPALLFYTFGDSSAQVSSLIHGLSGDARFRAIVKLLEPYYSRLPRYESTACTPLAALATEWSQDELAGFGSYSNFLVGMTRADSDVECIRHGMPEDHIWFCGEHTASFDGLGTVSGAYISGERVANRVIEARGKQSS